MYFCWFKHIRPAFANIMLGVVKIMTLYLVQMPSGQYGLLSGTTVQLVDWSYSLYDLQLHFGSRLRLY